VYVSDLSPGIRRKRRGRGFRYVGADGHPVTDQRELARIRAIVIPPAWSDVWICPSRRGHIQATGRDARGRKQYRYHPQWAATRDQAKYERLLDFGRALPAIRARTSADLALPGLPRAKVLAAVVALLESTCIRVGNEEYARQNGSYGLTTLRDEHAEVSGGKIRFCFRGKRGISHEVAVSEKRLAQIVRKCQDLPGQELFQYAAEDGQLRSVGSADVNEYIREVCGEDFSAKDFRTWAGTVLAAGYFAECPMPDPESEARRGVTEVVGAVAERLGNTPAVCRSCYIHPEVFNRFLDGSLNDAVAPAIGPQTRTLQERLRAYEPALLALLADARTGK
jgi:DNA topoisomerase-1